MISAQKSSNEEKTYENLMDIITGRVETMKQIKSALRYPKIIYALITCAFMFFMIWLIPKNVELLKFLDSKITNPFSQWLYDNSAYAVKSPVWFCIKSTVIAIIAYLAL